jgi:hypothetical protein
MDLFSHPEQREIVIAIISVMFNYTFPFDKDVALALFRLYDRIVHKKAEIDRLRRDAEFQSNLTFPHFMDLSVLRQLFKLLEDEHGDYSGNYGIQLYAVTHARAVISELAELRLEMRADRLKRTITIGQLLFDSLTKVKWTEAPAGVKAAVPLLDMVTMALKQLFSFVVETYSDENVERFLQKAALIGPSQRIADSHVILLQKIKQYVRRDQMKSADNFCSIAEQTSLFGVFDDRFFRSIRKMLNSLIENTSPFAGRILHLAKFFAPQTDLEWLIETNSHAATKLKEQEVGGLSSVLLEIIEMIREYLDDINWAATNWIAQVREVQPEVLAVFSSKLAVYLSILKSICDELLEFNFKVFPATYYEAMIKFLNGYYQDTDRLLKQTLLIPDSVNEQLSDLVAQITSEFDSKVIQFTLANQLSSAKHSKSGSRQDKFDAVYVPKLYGRIDTVRATVRVLVEKKLLEEDIPDSFCRLRGTDVKLPASKKKKSREPEAEPEPQREAHQEEEDAQEDSIAEDD